MTSKWQNRIKFSSRNTYGARPCGYNDRSNQVPCPRGALRPSGETDLETWVKTGPEGAERRGCRTNLRETSKLQDGVISELRYDGNMYMCNNAFTH